MEQKVLFSKKIAREIASKSFGHLLDCIMGYSDPDYSFNTPTSEYEQNFEEDLQEWGVTITSHRVEIIKSEFDKMKSKFEAAIRKKYYK